jgi:hypothetical protein
MPFGSQVALTARPQSAYISGLTITFLFALSCRAPGQTASTGALTGLTFGPSGSRVGRPGSTRKLSRRQIGIHSFG